VTIEQLETLSAWLRPRCIRISRGDGTPAYVGAIYLSAYSKVNNSLDVLLNAQFKKDHG